MAAAKEDSESCTGTIILKSTDDKLFTVPKQEAFLNENIKELFDPENEGEHVPVDVTSNTLKLMNEFNHLTIKHGTSLSKSVEAFDKEQNENNSDFGNDSTQTVPWYDRIEQWYHTFLDNLDKPTIGRLLMAADYLRNEELRHAVCLKIASLHHGLPAEKTRELFFGDNGLGDGIKEGITYASEAEAGYAA
jgi:hypothetical protein